MNPTKPAVPKPRNETEVNRTGAMPSHHAPEMVPLLTPMERWQNETFVDGSWNALHSFVPVPGWKECAGEKRTVSMKVEQGGAKNQSNL